MHEKEHIWKTLPRKFESLKSKSVRTILCLTKIVIKTFIYDLCWWGLLGSVLLGSILVMLNCQMMSGKKTTEMWMDLHSCFFPHSVTSLISIVGILYVPSSQCTQRHWILGWGTDDHIRQSAPAWRSEWMSSPRQKDACTSACCQARRLPAAHFENNHSTEMNVQSVTLLQRHAWEHAQMCTFAHPQDRICISVGTFCTAAFTPQLRTYIVINTHTCAISERYRACVCGTQCTISKQLSPHTQTQHFLKIYKI